MSGFSEQRIQVSCPSCGTAVMLRRSSAGDRCGRCGAKVEAPQVGLAGRGPGATTVENSAESPGPGQVLPELASWQLATSHRCKGCGTALQLDRHQSATVCPFCASAAIVEVPPRPGVVRPSFVLPFVVTRERARECVQTWQSRKRLFAPSALRKAAVDSVRAAYTPTYLYGAVARASWDASIGIIYGYTTTTDPVTKRKKKVPKIEWTDLSGQFAGYVREVLVAASHSVHNDALEAVEPFDLARMIRFDDKAIAGWVVEEPALTVAQCLPLARKEASEDVTRRVQAFLPGDRRSIKQVQSRFEQETIDGVLVPLWLMTLKWHPKKPPLRTLVNGQSGKVHGKVPLDPLKVGIAVGLVALLLVAAILVQLFGGKA
ncbi:MAG: hypothetical protein ABIJ09_15195 [Pseudomonadota bacterium]